MATGGELEQTLTLPVPRSSPPALPMLGGLRPPNVLLAGISPQQMAAASGFAQAFDAKGEHASQPQAQAGKPREAMSEQCQHVEESGEPCRKRARKRCQHGRRGRAALPPERSGQDGLLQDPRRGQALPARRRGRGAVPAAR